MALTVLQVKNAKAASKDFKLSDSGGLHLLVKANGAKYWRLAYRYEYKQKTLALGVYPEVSLQDARVKAMHAKKILNSDIDPAERQRSTKAKSNDTFKSIATEWYTKKKPSWSLTHARDVERRFERNIYPKIGHLPIEAIKATQVLNALQVIESRNANDLSHRVLSQCSQVFRYAVAMGKIDSDPTRDLKGALSSHKLKHQNAVASNELAALMTDISRYHEIGDLQTQLAIEMLAHTFVRTGELIKAEWDEFDFEKELWRIPASRMKMKREHLVPLTSQVIRILRQLQHISNGSKFVFSSRNQIAHISNNTILFALYKLGYKGKMTGHGFRSVASTVLNESNFRSDIIERQLAHLDSNSVRSAYNRAEYLNERRAMMEWWSIHLDQFTNSAVHLNLAVLLVA